MERAYLFGSQARGDAHPDSDIDLLLVSSSFAGMPVTEQWKILGKAVLAMMEPIEPLAYTPEEVQACLEREGNFIRHILRQLFKPAPNDRLLTYLPVRKLLDIMTITNL